MQSSDEHGVTVRVKTIALANRFPVHIPPAVSADESSHQKNEGGPGKVEVGDHGIHGPEPVPGPKPVLAAGTTTFRISGHVPPEVWNRLGTRILPKLRSGSDLKIGIEFSVTVDSGLARGFEADLKRILEDLGLAGRVRIEPAE